MWMFQWAFAATAATIVSVSMTFLRLFVSELFGNFTLTLGSEGTFRNLELRTPVFLLAGLQSLHFSPRTRLQKKIPKN